MSRHLAKALCATAALMTVSIPAGATHADAMYSEAAPSRSIAVPKDKSLSFRLDEPATKIVVAQPDIAEVVATTDRSFYVRGINPGSTNLLVYGPGGRLMQVIDVRVGFDAALLQADLKTAFPGEDLRVQNLGEGLLLTGTASTMSVATRALALAQKFAPDMASSNLLVRASQEVVLEVRVMEATRSALQDVGFSGSITSRNLTGAWGSGLIGNNPPNGVFSLTNHLGSVTVNATLAALEEKGVVHTLARPNLVAVSGGKASFLAGGEFPYPVPQQLNEITIQFREYGVKLNFEPVVQDNGLIRLHVGPEVSQLDQANAIKINGVQVPGLTTRKADTTVEIADGDSLAIGGLFMHNYTNDLRQFPVLGSIPILGNLFRSARWNRNETELVIVVTPHLVTAEDFRKGKAAVVEAKDPSPFDVMVKGHMLDKPMANDLRGPATPTAFAPAAPPLAANVPAKPVEVAHAAAPAPAPASPVANPATTATAAVAPAAASTVSKPTMAAYAVATPTPKAAATMSPIANPPARAAAWRRAPAKPAMTASAVAKPSAGAPAALKAAAPAPAAAKAPVATKAAAKPAKAPTTGAKPSVASTGVAQPAESAAKPASDTVALMMLRGAIAPKALSTGK